MVKSLAAHPSLFRCSEEGNCPLKFYASFRLACYFNHEVSTFDCVVVVILTFRFMAAEGACLTFPNVMFLECRWFLFISIVIWNFLMIVICFQQSLVGIFKYVLFLRIFIHVSSLCSPLSCLEQLVEVVSC